AGRGAWTGRGPLGPAPGRPRAPRPAGAPRMLPPAVDAVTRPATRPISMFPPFVTTDTSPPAESIEMLPPAVSALTAPAALPIRTSPPEVCATTPAPPDERRPAPPAVLSRASP